MLFHVTSVANRDSILKYGLDWSRMGRARGIAGSRGPEVDGVFLCRDEWEANWFIDLNNTGGPVDVWTVADVTLSDLDESRHGYLFLPRRIPASQLTLGRRDVPPGRMSDQP